MQELKVDGLRIREELEQVPFESAIEASDLYLDRDSFKGRNGYRTAIATAPGANSDNPQGLWRHRGSPASVRMLDVVGGKIFISDAAHPEPSTELLSDMTMTTLGTIFANTAKISGAQLHKHFYLGTDEANVALRRVKFSGTDTYTLESLESINQPAKPTATKGSLAWFVYRTQVAGGGASTSVSNCAFSTTVSGLLSTWYGIVGTGGDSSQPSDGATAKLTLTTAIDIRGADWLAVGVSPPDDSGNLKSVQIEISNDNTAWVTIGTITDRAPVADSPNLIFCDISGVSDTIKAAFKYIRFMVNQNGSANTLRYALYGHLVLYGRSPVLPLHYFVTAFNPTSLQESPLSPEATLSDGSQVSVSNDDVKSGAITYTDQAIGNDSYHSTTVTLSPFDPSNQRIYNKYAGLASPVLEQIGVPITVAGAMPSGYSGNLTARLWKQLENGLRLVITQATLAAGASYSLVDNGGPTTLASLLFKAVGTPPRMTGLCARDARLISVYENAVQISSFTPLASADTDPFPQWPLVAIEDSDGWSFTIDGGGSREQGQCCVSGDKVYILTNERALYLSGTQPNAPYYECAPHGVVSRRGAIWAKNSLMWASQEGIFRYLPTRYGQLYAEQNVVEMTEEIRDYYWRNFQPSNSTVLDYQQGSLYCFTGTRFIRYNFTTKRWTTGTIADTPLHSCRWFDVGSSTQIGHQLWFLLSDGSTHRRQIARWQPEYTVGVANRATSDAGTAIPDWQYSTGFYVLPGNALLKWMYADTDGDIQAYCEKTAIDADWYSVRPLVAGETERAFPPNPKTHKIRARFIGANGTTVKRLMMETEPVEARGG